LQHAPNLLRVANIDERIRVEDDYVRPLSDFDRAEILFGAEYAGGSARSGVDCLNWG
jgi:hypothetical protein